jgi:protein MpaA
MKKQTLRFTLWILASAVLPLLQSGCTPTHKPSPIAPILTPQHFTVKTLGYSIENRPIDLYLAGTGSETIFIFSGIHGNEQAGISLVHRLMDRLRQKSELLEGRKILIIPIANPDGVARNTRGNARGIDLNRNFTADNRENSKIFGEYALSEPESTLLYNLLQTYRPNRIVSIHQPLDCIDYDGPAEGLANHMAAYCPLPVKKLGARPGSFGAYAGETLSIPIITMELLRSDDRLTADQLWQKYGMALLASITYPNIPY